MKWQRGPMAGRHLGRRLLVPVLVSFFGGLLILDRASANPSVGREAAQRYFSERQEKKDLKPSKRRWLSAGPTESASEKAPEGTRPAERSLAFSPEDAPRFLSLHFGGFVEGKNYRWGTDREVDTGQWTGGVSYRLIEWLDLMDLLLRIDFLSYGLQQGRALKMSLMPVVTFPDVRSAFPLYFGAGLGPGVYLEQISDESVLALDYQLLAGIRLFNVWGSMGFLLEGGLKNHFHLLSDGQSQNVFLAGGAVFTF